VSGPRDEHQPSPLRRALVALIALAVIGVAGYGAFHYLTAQSGEDIDLVLVPPEQTRAPLQHLSDKGRLDRRLPQILHAVAGSHLVLRQSALGEVTLSTPSGPVSVFDDVDGTQWSVLPIEDDVQLTVKAGEREKGRIRIAVTQDQAPTAQLAAKVQITSRSILRVAVKADDDFGLTGLDVVLTPQNETLGSERIGLRFPPHSKSIDMITYLDLRDHALAGQTVGLHVEARDALDQTARSKTSAVRLLKRRYRSADAAILARHAEKLQHSDRYTNDVAMLLRQLAERHGETVRDTGLTLGFSVAYRQLTGLSLNGPAPLYPVGPAEPEIIQAAMPLLNDLAARLEDRRLADTQERWQSTMTLFDELLAPGADQRAFRSAHWQLRRAVTSHLSALFIDAVRHNRSFLLPIVRKGGGRPQLPDMIDQALHQLRRDTNHRAWETARKRLDALKDIVENSQSGLPVSHQSAVLYPLHQLSAAIGAVERLELALKRNRVSQAKGAEQATLLAQKIRPLGKTGTKQDIARSAAALERAARLLDRQDRTAAFGEVKEARAHLIRLANQAIADRLASVPGSVPQPNPSQEPGRLISDENYQRMRRLVTLIPMADMDTLKSDLLAALALMHVIAPER